MRHVRALAQHVEHAAKALGQSSFQAGVLQHKARHLRQAVADALEVALKGQVVGQIQLANARRVAAAAQVFQQQRVVQLPALLVAQAQRLGDVHTNPAAAHAVALGLAFGDVQCVAQGADEFGQLDARRQRKGAF